MIARSGRLAVMLAPALAILSACATHAAARIDPAPPLDVRWVHAHPGGEGTLITGFVRRRHAWRGPVPGYIRIEAVAAGTDGQASDASRVLACIGWRDMSPVGSRGATFGRHVALKIPAGAVQATYTAACAMSRP